jgi:hypothetical protein
MRLRIVRLQFQGVPVAGNCRVQPAQIPQCGAQVGMIRRGSTIDRNRLADQLDRLGVASLRLGDDTEQMQAVGMTRIGRQTLPIQSLGFPYATGLVVLQGGREHPWNGGRLARRFAR